MSGWARCGPGGGGSGPLAAGEPQFLLPAFSRAPRSGDVYKRQGVYTFRGGSDLLIDKMTAELRKNGVELRKKVLVERILVEERACLLYTSRCV